MRARLVLAALLVLIAGLVSGTVLYFSAPDEVDAGAYVIIGDRAYAVDPANSKTYRRDLERFGGKASLVFDDFNRWFAGLWRGKTLGITIAAIGVFAALILLAIAGRIPKND